MSGCAQAEVALLLETIEERIEWECGSKIPRDCYKVLRRVLNDLRAHGKDYVRSKYGI